MAKRTKDQEQTKAFKEIFDRARYLVEDYSERDTLFEEMEHIWHMDWVEGRPASKSKDVRYTVAPDGANAIVGGQRLMTASEPQFSMPFDTNDEEAKQASDKVERMADAMWKASGKINGQPTEKDCALAALLFAEVHIGLESTKQLVDEAGTDPLRVARAKAAGRRTPILFEAWHPKEGYPEFDRLGLYAYLRRYDITAGRLAMEWPEAQELLTALKPNAPVRINDWYDLEWRALWIESGSHGRSFLRRPFYMKRHQLGFIPVAVQIIEGSRMFSDVAKQRRPFLYTLVKSGLWNRQNLALTALYTTVFAIAQNAMFLHTAPPGTTEIRPLRADFGQIGAGVIDLLNGETFQPLFSKGAIDPSLLEAFKIAEQKATESTISRQALGEPLGANAPYSMVALLHQAGRLPLVGPKIMTGWAIARAMELAFKWIKLEGTGKVGASVRNRKAEIVASEIPEDFEMDVKLEVDLPQDKLQLAAVAGQLIGLGVTSRRYVREELMSIGQSAAMDEEIWGEKMAELMAMSLFDAMERMRKGGPGALLGPGGGGMPTELRSGSPASEAPAPPPGATGPAVPEGAPLPVPSQEPTLPAGPTR